MCQFLWKKGIIKKIETCMSKTHQSYKIISLKNAFSIWKDHYLIFASLDLFTNFSIERELSALKIFIFSAHNEILIQFAIVI